MEKECQSEKRYMEKKIHG